jgi:hypothetical protein
MSVQVKGSHLLIATACIEYMHNAFMKAANSVLRHNDDFNGNSEQVCHELSVQLRITPASISLYFIQTLLLTTLSHNLHYNACCAVDNHACENEAHQL